MPDQYSEIYCVHSLDETTVFLTAFSNVLPTGQYMTIEASDESLVGAIDGLKDLMPKALFVFLGHGYSRGIYSPQSPAYEKKVFIGTETAGDVFKGHDVILLSCKSADFISTFTGYNGAVGFGNIISSPEESTAEAEYTGTFRDLSKEDISLFNHFYVEAVSTGVKLLVENRIEFKDLKNVINFKINQYINQVLRDKQKANRLELAKLLFEFRNEMLFKVAV